MLKKGQKVILKGNKMSDAMTDIYRDQERTALEKEYLQCLLGYLTKSTVREFTKLEKIALSVDSVQRGYSSGQTNFSEGLKERVEKLKQGDKKEWNKFLNIFEVSNTEGSKWYGQFKELYSLKYDPSFSA